jgi:hypothetical protein
MGSNGRGSRDVMAGDASSVVRHHFADRPATSAGGVGSTSEVDGDRRWPAVAFRDPAAAR